MTQRYFANFENVDDIKREFAPYNGSDSDLDLLKDEEVLFAGYGTPGYEGYALVIFQRDGKLYEASGSHCSCNGLEGTWGPDEVTWPALAMRLDDIKKNEWHSIRSDFGEEAVAAFVQMVESNRS